MMTIWKHDQGKLIETETITQDCWVHVTAPDQEEVRMLSEMFPVDIDTLNDILDVDEQSRIEREDEWLLLIIRVPVFNANEEVPYYTVPLGVILYDDILITISVCENPILKDFIQGKIRNLSLANKYSFVLHIFMRSAFYFLRYLKDINRKTSIVEKDLQQSVKNNELIQLLTFEKCLVYFTTSLKSNELLMEKMRKPQLMRFKETEMDFLEDCLTENEQAIEMANIYSNILSGMMDAFASVISNNLNVVMKRLTTISIILMIPTLIASWYGMNVHLPFMASRFAFGGIMLSSVALSVVVALIFRKQKFF